MLNILYKREIMLLFSIIERGYMTNIAFIPVRGGSKSIPLKNIKEIFGKPLIYWTAKAANYASCIDKVIIATDSDIIKDTVLSFNFEKISIYSREAENAQDSSSTESVMLEYINKSNLQNKDNFFLIQATSPMLEAQHIDGIYKKYIEEEADSAFTAVLSKRFFWSKDAIPINYDYKSRPRRQDFNGVYLENGACYINTVENILKDKNRLSGKKTIFEMPEYTSYEIDEPDDFLIIEKLMERHFS